METERRPRQQNARARLLDAALDVIRARGLSATTVDDLCATAGVTKGAFFHHFETKEALAVEAARHWSATTGELFADAEYHRLGDPADRVLGYLDLRAALISGPPEAFSCLVGTMVQESFATSPTIRDACAASMFGHAATLERDLAAALDARRPRPDVNAASLAAHIQGVLQGAFILSKAAADPAVALDSIGHLRRYVESLVHQPERSHDMTDTNAGTLPEGPRLMPHLVCAGAADAIEFYQQAFGAEEQLRLPGPDGKLVHAAVLINGAMVLLVDEFPEMGAVSPKTLGGSAVTIHLVVPDVDAAVERAVAAGATVTMPVEDQFWGDRYGVVQDPFGHLWSLATPKPGAPLTAEELASAMADAPEA